MAKSNSTVERRRRKGNRGQEQKKMTTLELNAENEFQELYAFLEARYGFSKQAAKDEG